MGGAPNEGGVMWRGGGARHPIGGHPMGADIQRGGEGGTQGGGGDTWGGWGWRMGVCPSPPPLPPHLLRRSAAGEEVAIIVAVQGDVEHSRVAVESLLGAIAVVDVLQTRGGHTTQQHNTHDPPPPCPPTPSLAALTQSTMRMRPTLSFCCSSLAEMATELKKQKPLF